MHFPAALARPLGRPLQFCCLVALGLLCFALGQRFEVARDNRLDPFDKTELGTTWCDRETYHIALRVGPDSATLAHELAHEGAHVQQMRALGCKASAHRPSPIERLQREAGALCAEAHYAVTTDPIHDVQEYDDVAPQLEERYGMLTDFSPATINTAADSACAPYKKKAVKRRRRPPDEHSVIWPAITPAVSASFSMPNRKVSPEVAAAISAHTREVGRATYEAIQNTLATDRSPSACLEEDGALAAVNAARSTLKAAILRDIDDAVAAERGRCRKAVIRAQWDGKWARYPLADALNAIGT
jgi:hypothetical protein